MESEVANETKEEKADKSICPGCGNVIETHKCRFCGARKTINSVSGNVIWMRNGRIVRGGAFADEKAAWVAMAAKWGIPRDQWPKQFLI